MVSKCFVITLGVTLIAMVIGAPKAIHTEQDLKQSVVEFLTQDKEFLAAVEGSQALVKNPVALVRQRRQSEVDEMGIDTIDQEAKTDGFFDRAAKFVVDLLQRFLKWINSDSN
ncbi:hypothetical protein JTB14_005920 [Gonioctena quinquepunctata]|nr:hypothetical protein JTB14_005920 [Gonioctena quinquepunctata]